MARLGPIGSDGGHGALAMLRACRHPDGTLRRVRDVADRVDLLFRGATVVDGTGGPASTVDVAVVGDRISAVGEQLDVVAGTTIDGTDRVLAPGFIDTHTHDDFAAVLHPDMAFKVRGGVTTCVVGNCGMGAAPWRIATLFGRAFHPDAVFPDWDGYGGYLSYLDAEPPSVNVAALAGHGTIRGGAMFLDDGAPTDGDMARMRSDVEEAMDAGCIGLSTGLIYEPGCFADTDELVALAEVVADAGGIYTSHIRDEASGLLDAIDEAVTIGRRARLPVVISHLKAAGRQNWGMVGEALDRIEAAGLEVSVDQYPYTAGSTVLSAVVGGRGLGDLDPADVVIASTDGHPEWHGRSLAHLAPELGCEPVDAGAAALGIEPSATVVLHTMCEDDVRHVLSDPQVMVGSDGIPSLGGQPHPRLYGSFARVLGRYVREESVLSVEAAVHKMTGRSAAVFGLADRGEIRAGACADLVLFDPETILDLGTYEDPQRHPAGIEGVWVNGRRVVDADGHTGDRPGRVLRR